jgi:hypothetical protein
MVLGKPAPFVRAFVDAVDAAIRTHQPPHALSVTPRTWLAFCITAVLVTNALCWARLARASLGTSALAALSWMFRHRKMPWEHLLVARVRGILRHQGITAGPLVLDDPDNPRSTAAKDLDVHFISSLPVMPGTAYKAWVDSKPVQMVWGAD